jgi:hypothetical protein
MEQYRNGEVALNDALRKLHGSTAPIRREAGHDAQPTRGKGSRRRAGPTVCSRDAAVQQAYDFAANEACKAVGIPITQDLGTPNVEAAH